MAPKSCRNIPSTRSWFRRRSLSSRNELTTEHKVHKKNRPLPGKNERGADADQEDLAAKECSERVEIPLFPPLPKGDERGFSLRRLGSLRLRNLYFRFCPEGAMNRASTLSPLRFVVSFRPCVSTPGKFFPPLAAIRKGARPRRRRWRWRSPRADHYWRIRRWAWSRAVRHRRWF
jgi:hypothetical protein